MLPKMSDLLRRRKPVTCINMYDAGIMHPSSSRSNFYICSRSVVIYTWLEICCH